MSSFSDQGAERKEIVASHIDALSIKNADATTKSVRLHLPVAVTGPAQRISHSLIDLSNNAKHTIPQGAIIHSVEVVSKAAMGSDFVCFVGFFSDFVKDNTRKQTLLKRVCDDTNPLTGPLLNQHKRMGFGQQLRKPQLTAQNTLYDAEASAQGLPARPAVNYNLLGDNDVALNIAVFADQYVGESKSVIPACTVVAGTCAQKDLEFIVTYSC